MSIRISLKLHFSIDLLMFSLFAGLWGYLFSKSELHILIIGFDNAGKTTLIEQLKNIYGKKPGMALDKIPPTVGLNLARVDIAHCKVIFWDLGGQEKLRVIWSKYYKESHGLIYVIDSIDTERIKEIKDSLESMINHPDLVGIPILILANKQDLQNALKIETVSEKLEISTFKNHECVVQPISAINRTGVEEAVEWFIHTVKDSERYSTIRKAK